MVTVRHMQIVTAGQTDRKHGNSEASAQSDRWIDRQTDRQKAW